MVSCDYLRRQAAVCLRLAAAVKDRKVAGALAAMADEFSDRADEIDPSLGSNGKPAMEDGAGDAMSRQPRR
jgi:hypothetical protein